MSLRSLLTSTYVYIVIFILGAAAFLYPLISSTVNTHAQTRVITSYHEEMAQLEEAERQRLRAEAEEYNEFVAGLEGNVTDEITEEEKEVSEVVYLSVLATGEAIGYLEIPKIEVDLPIFRGSSDDVLSRGVGHLERSSLPIGGESTHSVLSSHRGLPSSRLFRDLGLLEEGDIFIIDTLDEKIAYEIERIQRVIPTDVESLRIQEGRDLCTLVTCDPYMINSHRLLLTGHRVDYSPSLEEEASEHSITFFEKYIEYFVIVGVVLLVFIAVWLARRMIIKKRRAEEDTSSTDSGSHD